MVNQEENVNVDIEKQLMLTVWILAKPDSFLAVSDRFGLPKSTTHGIFKNIVEVLAQLMPQYVQWPNEMQHELSCQVCCFIKVIYTYINLKLFNY